MSTIFSICQEHGTIAHPTLDVNRRRLSTYAELHEIAAENKCPKTFADAFFPSESRSEEAVPEEPETPAAPPVPPTE